MENKKEIKKMTKKELRAFYNAQRGSWMGVNPVTRRPANPKAYNRRKAKAEGRLAAL